MGYAKSRELSEYNREVINPAFKTIKNGNTVSPKSSYRAPTLIEEE
jgi:hypothetical protein